MLDVTSWFMVQLEDRSSKPVRQFLIGTSDYSDRVLKWPTIKRTANDLRTSKITVQLDNADGVMNHFYAETYKIVQRGYLKLGFTHADSGTEYVTLYTGECKEVSYKDERCDIKMRDLLHGLSEKKVGDSSNPVTMTDINPIGAVWYLCASYGYLSTITSNTNPDIDMDTYYAVWSSYDLDSVLVDARFDGGRVIEGISAIADHADFAVFTGPDGKIKFKKFVEPDSNDLTITHDHYTDFQIDVETLRLVNKAFIDWEYSAASDYWLYQCYSVNSTSVDSFGVHDKLYRSENVWYVDSVSALVAAQRMTTRYSNPPRRFVVNTDLYAMRPELGETIRLVDSFFSITSGGGWRLVEQQINMDTGRVVLEMDETATLNGFFLDVSNLDGDEVLL